jgi:hypothetical protein
MIHWGNMNGIEKLCSVIFDDERERRLLSEENEVSIKIRKITVELEDFILPRIEGLLTKVRKCRNKFLRIACEAYNHLYDTLISLRHLILKNGEWYFYFLGERNKTSADIPKEKGDKCAGHNAADEGPVVASS